MNEFYLIVIMGGKTYARPFDPEDADHISHLKGFLDSGDVVIMCDDLESLEDYGVKKEDIVMVELD